MPKVWMEKAEAEEFLRNSKVGRLGLCVEDEPYVVPMLFAYKDEKIFLHSARRGRKIEALKENSRVCFEVDEYGGVRPASEACSFSINYRSVMVFGKARLVRDPDEKFAALMLLMEKYEAGYHRKPTREAQARKVEIIEISIAKLVGKKNIPERVAS